MLMRSAFLRHHAGRRLYSEYAGWAENSCLTSRRIHEAVSGLLICTQLGPRLFQWFEQLYDTIKVIAADRACQRHQNCKGQHEERDHRSGSDGFSEYLVGFRLLP